MAIKAYAVIVEKNKTAILTVIFEYKQGVNLEELKKALFEKGGALEIEMESLDRRESVRDENSRLFSFR